MFIPTIILFFIAVIAGLILLQRIAFAVIKLRVLYIFIAATIYITLLAVYLQSGESVLITTSLVVLTLIAGGCILYTEEVPDKVIKDG